MATATVPQAVRPSSGSRADNYFFSGMAVLCLIIVVVGFAQTYFLAGIFRAPLPSVLVHIHGALFSSWILLFIAQVSLVSAGRVDLHRRLGLFGFWVACLMVIVGVLTATGMLARGVSPVPGFDAQAFYAIPLSDIFLFAALIYLAYRERIHPAAHKRLILVATIVLMDAPTGRPPFAAITSLPHLDAVFCWALLAIVIGYDIWSMRRVHWATVVGTLMTVLVTILRAPIAMTTGWHGFAAWAQGLARSIH